MGSGSITGTMLRDLALCERRVHHDHHSIPGEKDPVSDFVQMLWAGGINHEGEILGSLNGTIKDLRTVPSVDLIEATIAALGEHTDWIVGGRLEFEDLVGMPDLLHLHRGRWYAGDVKAGTPFAADGERPKTEYSVQVGLYAEILASLSIGSGDRTFIIGGDGELVWYDMEDPVDRAGTTLRQRVRELIGAARTIRDGAASTKGAIAAICGMCHWKTKCTAELVAADDLTQIAQLGRAVRNAMIDTIPTVAALAKADLDGLLLPNGKTTINGVGAARLKRFQDRALLLSTPGARPFARRPLGLSRAPRELHFDIEADPMRKGGYVYLHGFIERIMGQGGDQERFVHFFAEGEDGERDAFASAYAFLTADPEAKIYYYSKFERTSYRALQKRYPNVCSEEDIEALFDPRRAIDLLFDVVMPATEWPTRNNSIKTLAKFSGFSWRDVDAGGAASIAWFHQYEQTGDAGVRNRIVEYNCDDCIATRVLLDALIALPVRPSGPDVISLPVASKPLF